MDLGKSSEGKDRMAQVNPIADYNHLSLNFLIAQWTLFISAGQTSEENYNSTSFTERSEHH